MKVPNRVLVAVIATSAAVIAVTVPLLILRSDSGPTGSGSAADPPVVPAATTSSTETTQAASTENVEVAAVTSEVPPYLLLNGEGWVIESHDETTYVPQAGGPTAATVYRLGGGDLGEGTLVVSLYERTEIVGWSAGPGAELLELEDRTVSISVSVGLTGGHAAGVELEDGTFLVVEGYGMDRETFSQAAAFASLLPDGSVTLRAPKGYEVVADNPRRLEAVFNRVTRYRGEAAWAEVRLWSGTRGDVERQVTNRVLEGHGSRRVSVAGMSALAVDHSEAEFARFFIVGGTDDYVVEIDFSTSTPGFDDTDLDVFLAQIVAVDASTFESHLSDDHVMPDESAEVVASMLADIPLPPGFDSTLLRPTGDPLYVGMEVAGAVTCGWIEEWVEATAKGDSVAVQQAVDAMSTSPAWGVLVVIRPVLPGFPEAVESYADAMASDGMVSVDGVRLPLADASEDAFCRR